MHKISLAEKVFISFFLFGFLLTTPAFAAEKAWLGVQLGAQEQFKHSAAWRFLGRFTGRRDGVFVREVIAGSPAEQMGIKQNDIILAFNYKDILTTNELTEAVSALNPGDRVVILISRLTEGIALLTITGTLGQSPGLAETEQIPKRLEEVKPVNTKISAKTFAPIGQVAIGNVVFSPDGRYGLSVSHNTFILWDVATGRQLRTFVSNTTPIYSTAFSPDGRYVLSGSKNYTIKLWNVESGKEIRTFTGRTITKIDGDDLILSVVFSPDGRYALSGCSDRTLQLWDIATGREIRTFTGHEGWVRSVAFSPDGRYALSGGEDKTYGVMLPGGTFQLQRAGSNDKMLILWEVATGREIRQFKVRASGVSKVAFSPDGRYGLSESNDNTLKLWDVSTGRELRTSDAGQSLCFSPDLSYSISFSFLGGGFKLRDIATGREIKTFTGHTGDANTAAFSNDGKSLISGGKDGSTRLWDIKTGKEIAQFISLKDGEWIVVTPEGYYNSSPNGHKYLNISVSPKVYGIDQFYDVFYRPDIVAAKLRGDDISSLITLTIDDAIKNPPPTVEFTSVPSATDQSKVKVCYQVKSTGGGIGEVRLFHNGKLIESDGYYKDVAKTSEKMQLASLTSNKIYEDMRSVKIKSTGEISPIKSKVKGEQFEDCKKVDAIPGENEISLSAFNSSNTVQSYMQTAKFNSTIKPEEPHLYMLSIGIDQYKDKSVNLKYALKDAKDIKEKLLSQSATLYKPQNIHHELLTDKDATKTNILNKINEISQKIKPSDSFILFVAGHGILLQNQYYMLTSEYDGNINENTMISSNEIVEMSKKIKSLSQLFIFDTCHAGGVDYIVSGLYDARMSVLAKKMGLHIYASANDKQAAMDGYKGNGLFTYTLLDGLNNKKEADKNNDKKVSLIELGEYSKMTTTDISKKIGHTQTPLIINFGKDNPVYNLR